MIEGIGIDIVELKRIEHLINRQPRFIKRILTAAEQERYDSLSGQRQLEYAAGRFAAKEAYSKAVGTGIGSQLSFLDIEVLTNDKGRPVVSGASHRDAHVSISHSKEYAVAQVIIESSSS